MQANNSRTQAKRNLEMVAIVAILVAGFLLRTYHLTSVPKGLHRDEMMEIYDAWSLLKTGADRWGNRWPAYFLSWGSGQNVLQAYLSIPVVALTGLTPLAARFIPALFGVLLLPLFYIAMRRWYGALAALVGLVIVTFSPWQLMLSRWGVENNQLPFFILLGLYLFRLALDKQSKTLTLCALVPFALALYSYGVFVVILPTLLLLLFVAYRQKIIAHWRSWIGAAVVASILAAPIGLFVFKNYVAKHDFAFEQHLPFTVPYMRITRLAQASAEINYQKPYARNFRFISEFFRDPHEPWYNVQPIPPLPEIVLLLAALGIIRQITTAYRAKRYNDVFGIWLVSCLPLFLLFALNISRLIAFFLPLIALAAVEFATLYRACKTRGIRWRLVGICSLAFIVSFVKFLPKYFGPYYADMISEDFHPEMPEAIKEVRRLSAGRMPMYITNRAYLDYVDVLFYEKVDPAHFQRSGATWINPDFDQYRFNYLLNFKSDQPFAFLLLRREEMICNNPTNVEVVGQFVVGTCDSPGSHSVPQTVPVLTIPAYSLGGGVPGKAPTS